MERLKYTTAEFLLKNLRQIGEFSEGVLSLLKTLVADR